MYSYTLLYSQLVCTVHLQSTNHNYHLYNNLQRKYILHISILVI